MKLIFSLTNDKLSCDWCLYKADENQRIESPFDYKVKLFLAEYFMFSIIVGVLFFSVSDPGF